MLYTSPLMAGGHHLEQERELRQRRRKDCDGVNVDSRSANISTFGARLLLIQGGVYFVVVPVIYLYSTKKKSCSLDTSSWGLYSPRDRASKAISIAIDTGRSQKETLDLLQVQSIYQLLA
jgi:hypothetical protein